LSFAAGVLAHREATSTDGGSAVGDPAITIVKPQPDQPSMRLRVALFAAAIGVVIALSWLLPVRDWTVVLAERLRSAGGKGVFFFIAVYVAAEVALVPGSLLTMAAGFAYGPILGLFVASPASVLAATVAFVLGRTVLREWIQKKIAASPKARALDRAMVKDSFRLILLLRLSPLIPFNVLNYALGLSNVNLRRYVVASFVGMLPGTWLYVYLGSLARTAAGLTDASRGGGPQRLALTIAGLVATVVVVVLVTRSARRALEEELRATP
jgi:uncharacterized membrane protein YdjX (TVP38/TMEM64 family)